MWTEIFKAGKHTDSSGNIRDWTGKDLDHIAGTYDPKKHEAPVVIGHPKDNSPAFGWVETVKRENDVLYAKMKDLVPEFVDMLKRKLFKKRSIGLYPDLSLRHVGFLGAVPPAVKGLADLSFKDDSDLIFFEMPLIEAGAERTFTESEATNMVEQAKQTAREEAAREFAEQQRKEDIRGWVESKIKEGRLPPRFKDMGLITFMQELSNHPIEIEFSEDQKLNLVEFMKSFIEDLPKLNLFSEIATKARAGQAEAEIAAGKRIAAKANPKT